MYGVTMYMMAFFRPSPIGLNQDVSVNARNRGDGSPPTFAPFDGHLLQCQDVGMREHFQQSYLADGGDWQLVSVSGLGFLDT